MAKYLKNSKPEKRPVQQNNASSRTTSLRKVRRNIYRQAGLALLTIVLTIVILFAMTSAWYTNIVQTGGLTFEAEAWGFEGTIKIAEGSVQAAPGDDGIVALTVKNDNDSMSAISVNVSKTGMDKEMQKRLYFYVDTRMNREGETMERVYLNRYEGYTYNVFGNGKLTMTEQISNAPVIKWEWVYDVLGYYIVGQPYEIQRMQTVTDENGNEATEPVTTRVMDIKEYLRPIEYDFDEATTVIVTEDDKVSIELDTVNGQTSPEAYLYRISCNDGYPGVIDVANGPAFGNYYAVDVDEEGYGVYAYLCSYTDIQQETAYDSYLGELAYQLSKDGELTDAEKNKLYSKVTFTLSAQKNENTALNVGTLSSLQGAIDLGLADVVQLTSDIAIPGGQTLVIPKDSRIMLDLNGHTITDVEGTAIDAQPGSSLTMTNGKLVHEKQEGSTSTETTRAIYTVGAEVVMKDVEIEGFQYGLYMVDNMDSNELDSRIHMVDSKIIAENYAVFISGNGLLSDQKTQLILENCDLESNSIVISGNGDTSGNGRWGTDIQIINSRIHGRRADENSPYAGGIYQPQKNSTLTLYNSYVEGYNGVTIKGGEANIIDTDIRGLGPAIAEGDLAFGKSGYCDTGDAVYIETNYGYDIELNISEGSILTTADENAKSLRVFEEDATNVVISIESGTFDEEQPLEYLAENSAQSQGTDAKFTVTTDN